VANHAGDNDDTSSDKGSDGNNTDDGSNKDSNTPENYAKPCAANSTTKLENAEKMDVRNNIDSNTSLARSLPLFAKSQSATKTEKAAKGVENDMDSDTSLASSLPLSAKSWSTTEKKAAKRGVGHNMDSESSSSSMLSSACDSSLASSHKSKLNNGIPQHLVTAWNSSQITLSLTIFLI
jgi:hypothetical protein